MRIGMLFRIKLVLVVLIAGLSFVRVAAYSGDHYRVCNLDPQGDNFLAFREGPTSNSPMLMKLPPRYDVEVRGTRENGRWFPAATVDAKGTFIFGYVFDAYVCPVGKPLISQ